jgi:hypothetical protein
MDYHRGPFHLGNGLDPREETNPIEFPKRSSGGFVDV